MDAYFQAHARLSTCRNANGDIPWTAIDAYAQRYNIQDFDLLEDCIYAFERVRRAITSMMAEQKEEE